ncbi:OmpA family protein [Oceanomicrobium pacificus]|uniref:OmpA family protein n=1 Tax=Oceanomicrobium pacificus TaxID=2692916 RepID=A0A6B0TXX4_9RHOB|nr:OmpA family protein [Oceanomicrobium pacificus]MXU65914.1 OmpA family protein [Oceanomicrobium pacificus]
MRAQARRLRQEEEEESAFISMTDMTVGFLFIMMILLAFFASQMQDSDVVPRSELDRIIQDRDAWQQKAELRAELILRLEAQIEALKQQRNQLQLQVTNLNAALDIERVRVAELVSEIDLARTQIAELEERILALLQQISALDDWLEELARQRDQLLDQVKNLKVALDVERARVTELVSELDLARSRIVELEERILALLQQISEREKEIEDLRRQLAELQQIDPLEAYLAQVAQARREVLQRLRDAIKVDFPDLQVELSEESDALRFQGEGLFASGRSDLARDRRGIVARLAERLDEVLPCFTLGEASRFENDCNPGFVMIEAVQIEGHTDDVGTDRINRNLSAARANSTFFAMTQAASGIMQHQNLKRQPVLSVAAYGPDRPVASNETPTGRATNRRIDLRFIMVTPQDTDGIDIIREALKSVGDPQ